MTELPILSGAVRFAVGDPDGLTTNSWRVWNEGDDVYVACRDNARETKASLHASGKWRFGFTSEAVRARPELAPDGSDRTWERWQRPAEQVPGFTRALDLFFLRSELAVTPELRPEKLWRDNVYLPLPPEGFAGVVSVTFTAKPVAPTPVVGIYVQVAHLALPGGEHLHVVYHTHREADASPDEFRRQVLQFIEQHDPDRIAVPPDGYIYALAARADGTRCIVGGRPPSLDGTWD
jgi:hypothetical protein